MNEKNNIKDIEEDFDYRDMDRETVCKFIKKFSRKGFNAGWIAYLLNMDIEELQQRYGDVLPRKKPKPKRNTLTINFVSPNGEVLKTHKYKY